MKEVFDELAIMRAGVDAIEEGLRALRDTVDAPLKVPINQAILAGQQLRAALWKADKVAETEAEKRRGAKE